MNILEDIVAYQREKTRRKKEVKPFLEFVKELDKSCPEPKFLKKISSSGLHLIAEVKKASPSAGIIRKDFQPVEIARAYEEGGASCLSILTEDKFFLGDLTYLGEIRRAVKIPLLRKDFIVDEYQVYESKVHGADAILLITSILTPKELKDRLEETREVRLDALVEVHSEDELKMALDCGSEMIGINTRDLKDFTIDFGILERLLKIMPKGKAVVAESGIKSVADLARIKPLGARAVLVGEALMRSKDIAATTKEFVSFLKSL